MRNMALSIEASSRRKAPVVAMLGGAGLALSTAVAGGGPVVFTPVAVGGQTAPSTGGAQFATSATSFSTPSVNALGQVAFAGALLQAGPVTASNDQGVWAGSSSMLAVASREGDAAPGAGGALFGTQVLVGFGDGGHVALRSSLTGTGVIVSGGTANSVALWSGTPGSLGMLARENFAAPGLGSAVFAVGAFTSAGLAINPAGQSAFFANLRTAVGGVTAANDRTLWVGTPGSLTLAAREGSAAPGTIGANFNVLPSTVALNGSGQIAFTGSLTGGDSVTGVNSAGLWVGPAGGLALAARMGDVAPGTGGSAFASPLEPTLNADGRVMFRAGLTGAGIDPTNDQGLWSGVPGSLALVARKGEPAPGVPGGVFTNVGLGTRLYSGSDRVVFNGSANDGGASDLFGLWHGEPGSITKIAVTGDSVPGITGAQFDGNFTGISANSVGQVAFTAVMNGAGVDSTNDLGLFVANALGDLDLVLRKGDIFDANPALPGTDLRTISDIRLTGGAALVDGRLSAFNDDGVLAVLLNFTDGTAAVATAMIAVPAPGSVLVLGLSGGLALRRRR